MGLRVSRSSGGGGDADPSLTSLPSSPVASAAPWIDDRASSCCMMCEEPFTLFWRRHHCRNCGRLVCYHCSIHRAVARGYTSPQRVCATCKLSLMREELARARGEGWLTQESLPSPPPAKTNSCCGGTKQAETAASGDIIRDESIVQGSEVAASDLKQGAPSADSIPSSSSSSSHQRTFSTSFTTTAASPRHPTQPSMGGQCASRTVHLSSSSLSLSVGGDETMPCCGTSTDSPSANASASSRTNSPAGSVRALARRKSISPAASPSNRRRSISGMPEFQQTPLLAAAAAAANPTVAAAAPEAVEPAPSSDASSTLPASSSAASVSSLPPVESLPPFSLFNRLGGFGSLLVLDTRSSDLYKESHVPRSLSIPLTEEDVAEGQIQVDASEASQQLSVLEKKLHLTDQRAFRMRQRSTVILVSLPPPSSAHASSLPPTLAPFSLTPFLSSHHDPLALHLAHLLLSEGKVASVAIVQGGFEAFRANYPFVCCSYTNMEKKTGRHIHKKPFPWYPNELLSNALYLGSKVDASNLQHLQHLGITHILNCTEEIPNHFEEERKHKEGEEEGDDREEEEEEEEEGEPLFQYKRITLQDEVNVKIAERFQEAFEFIDSALSSGGRVLVHCQEGISRSSTMLIAYFMRGDGSDPRQPGLSLLHSYSWCKAQRKQVFPNLGFWKQLSLFERQQLQARMLKEAEDPSSVPPLEDIAGTLDQCIDVDLLTKEYKERKRAAKERMKAEAAAAAANPSSSPDPSPSPDAPASIGARWRKEYTASLSSSLRGVAAEDARHRAEEALVEEAQTPCGPVVTSDRA